VFAGLVGEAYINLKAKLNKLGQGSFDGLIDEVEKV